MRPPDGWLQFGSLIEYDGPREFSVETGDDGLPLWERATLTNESAEGGGGE